MGRASLLYLLFAYPHTDSTIVLMSGFISLSLGIAMKITKLCKVQGDTRRWGIVESVHGTWGGYAASWGMVVHNS